jgi:hypothetical protein
MNKSPWHACKGTEAVWGRLGGMDCRIAMQINGNKQPKKSEYRNPLAAGIDDSQRVLSTIGIRRSKRPSELNFPALVYIHPQNISSESTT